MAPNGRQRVRSGVLRGPNCVLCAPNRPRSVADPERGPPGTVWGRFGPIRPHFGPVWGGFPSCGRHGAEWGGSLELKTRAEGGHNRVKPTLDFEAVTRPGATKNLLLWCACLLLLLASLFLLWGEGCSIF